MDVFHPKTSLKIGQSGTCHAKPKDVFASGYVDDGEYEFIVEGCNDDIQLPWVYLERLDDKVFDCNPQFFESHFDFKVTATITVRER